MLNAAQIGSPRAWDYHQEIIVETIFNMRSEVKSKWGWKILPEALVTKNPNDNYPDIIIKDETGLLMFSMEITNRRSINYDRRKCVQLKQRFPNAEFFIFNYETDILLTLGDDGNWYDSNEYNLTSRLFSRPVLDYIYIPQE